MIARPDWRSASRVAALALLAATLVVPPLAVKHGVYDLVAVLDITGSMNVRDQSLDGAPASRIALEKRAVRGLLAALPCGSRLGLAIFVERQPFLLFEPADTCADFSALDREIDAVDWRMGWDSESHIATGLLEAMRMAGGLGADLVFLTDGQETPPLAWDGAPDFSALRGSVRGAIEGVGGRALVPIPKFDTDGREIGVFRPGDVPSEQAGLFRGREHLSAVDEPHLRSLAGQSGLAYAHLDGPDRLLADLAGRVSPRTHPGTMDIGWALAAAAWVLLVASGLPRETRRQGGRHSLHRL